MKRQQMNQPPPSRPRSARPTAAVIGAGVSGLTAAHVLRATYRALARTTARGLLMTRRVSLLIRRHGIRLWLRRLPVQPRPSHAAQESVR